MDVSATSSGTVFPVYFNIFVTFRYHKNDNDFAQSGLVFAVFEKKVFSTFNIFNIQNFFSYVLGLKSFF